MRTIKFRGKQLEDIKETEMRYGSKKGEWRYGSYLYAHKYRGGEHAYLICNIYGEECIMCDKETIGQSTGLYDKNGKEIWENDKVKLIDCNERKIYCSVEQITGAFWYVVQINQLTIGMWEYYNFANKSVEVIGNIHESDKHE